MITSLLIANRGEIAARIIRTCRRLNIRAVAVYSEADRHAPHVALADEAYGIGPAESAASYLNADAIIAVALRAKVDAIHPGYGFLSESDALISLCEKQNIIFVGPNREAVRLMGSKLEAKRSDKATAKQEFAKAMPEGEELHALLLHTFNFAYRNSPDVLEAVRRISLDRTSRRFLLEDARDKWRFQSGNRTGDERGESPLRLSAWGQRHPL